METPPMTLGHIQQWCCRRPDGTDREVTPPARRGHGVTLATKSGVSARVALITMMVVIT